MNEYSHPSSHFQPLYLHHIHTKKRKLLWLRAIPTRTTTTYDRPKKAKPNKPTTGNSNILTLLQCSILPFRESPVLVTMSAAGLITLIRHANVVKNRTVLTAEGAMEVIPYKLFYVLIENFFPQPIHIPKVMNFVVVSLLLDSLMQFQNYSAPKSPKDRRGK